MTGAMQAFSTYRKYSPEAARGLAEGMLASTLLYCCETGMAWHECEIENKSDRDGHDEKCVQSPMDQEGKKYRNA